MTTTSKVYGSTPEVKELIPVEKVTIALDGKDYQELLRDAKIILEQKIALRKENDRLADQLYQSMAETAEYRKENDRINSLLLVRSSTINGKETKIKRLVYLFRAVWQAYKRRWSMLSTSNMHLDKMLEEKEHEFERTGQFESMEICRDYVDAASYMEKNYGRRNNQVEEAKAWYASQPVPSSLFDNFKGIFNQ